MKNTITFKSLVALCTLSLLSFLSIAQQTDEMKMKTYLTSIECYKYEGDTIQSEAYYTNTFKWYDNQQLRELTHDSKHFDSYSTDTLRYNEQGQETEHINGELDGNMNWIYGTKSITNYNEAAKILTKYNYRKSSDDTDFRLTSIKSYTYDDDNITLLESKTIFYNDTGDDMSYIFQNMYTYQDYDLYIEENLNLLVINQNPLEYDTIIYNHTQTFRFEDRDSIVKKVHTSENPILSVDNICLVTRTENEISKAHFNIIDGNYSKYADELIVLNNNGSKIKHETIEYTETKTYISDTICEYNSNNDLIIKEQHYYVNDYEVNSKYERKEFVYNDDFQLISEIDYYKYPNTGNEYSARRKINSYTNNGSIDIEDFYADVVGSPSPYDAETFFGRGEFTSTNYLMENTLFHTFQFNSGVIYSTYAPDHMIFNQPTYYKDTDTLTKKEYIKYNYEERLFDVSSIDTESVIEYAIYPNPTDGVFTISSEENNQSTIEIYNQTGSLCHSEKFNQETRIDISHLPSSIYYCRIISEDGKVTTRKIILQ